MAADEIHPEAAEVMQKIARYPEGRVAILKMILDEFQEIHWHMAGVVARCEAAKAKEATDERR